ncbi:hypothetical protein PILCRDRAFT_561105 [Piloderma croceum F 1598]|uniref:Uncharacterized protein n=1 Tax=Piloderma croceum (strain F 1598) TaxID=765440 RepID=A0A0C3F3B7_PILCF|nr:hypothetical protein PILCRDRAFT_561105 [Piloderma croceum F 1598]
MNCKRRIAKVACYPTITIIRMAIRYDGMSTQGEHAAAASALTCSRNFKLLKQSNCTPVVIQMFAVRSARIFDVVITDYYLMKALPSSSQQAADLTFTMSLAYEFKADQSVLTVAVAPDSIQVKVTEGRQEHNEEPQDYADGAVRASLCGAFLLQFHSFGYSY